MLNTSEPAQAETMDQIKKREMTTVLESTLTSFARASSLSLVHSTPSSPQGDMKQQEA